MKSGRTWFSLGPAGITILWWKLLTKGASLQIGNIQNPIPGRCFLCNQGNGCQRRPLIGVTAAFGMYFALRNSGKQFLCHPVKGSGIPRFFTPDSSEPLVCYRENGQCF